ncbi:MAG: rod shape-determining protein MreC [Bacteroidia bacterium]
MFRIIQFLSEYRNAFFWLFLQFIAIILIVNYNNAQRHVIGDWALGVSGSIQDQRTSFKNYFSLKTSNDNLMKENIVLHQKITNLRSRLDYLEGKLTSDSNKILAYDTSKVQKVTFKYTPCRSVNNSTDKDYNYITLDKGSNDGIKPGMGVISPTGVVGKVIRVSKNYSLALSMLNQKFRLSAKVSRTGNVGMYEWGGGDSRRGFLNFIPQDVELRIGDTVTTSGYAEFPEGFIVGLISDNKQTIGGFYKAKITLSTDFTALKDLYIVEAQHIEQIDSLMNGIEGLEEAQPHKEQ